MNYYVDSPYAAGYTQRQTGAQFNQNLAQAHANADPRFNTKPLDRAGMSRGMGQQHMAGIASAQQLAEGVAKAYTGQAQDAATNAGIATGNAQAAEGLGLGMNAIAQQQQYANALAALQRQQNAMNMNQNVLGGLLGDGGSSSNWLDNLLGF
jgi:hypothetical protein